MLWSSPPNASITRSRGASRTGLPYTDLRDEHRWFWRRVAHVGCNAVLGSSLSYMDYAERFMQVHHASIQYCEMSFPDRSEMSVADNRPPFFSMIRTEPMLSVSHVSRTRANPSARAFSRVSARIKVP